VSAPDRITRRALASRVLTWSAAHSWPLVVGNGFLSREVQAAGDGDHVMHLLAGMGLAPAFAAGLAEATGGRAVALEGDGNHLMGLPATATIGLRRTPVVHVVHWNGGWESTGGQRLVDDGRHLDVGPALGYAWTAVARDDAELEAALDRAAGAEAPLLVHAIGTMGEPPAPRTTLTMVGSRRRLERWLAGQQPGAAAGEVRA
jgi:thiamine pyrophosphate-dependent acetolactate synthase large subunit-like protein